MTKKIIICTLILTIFMLTPTNILAYDDNYTEVIADLAPCVYDHTISRRDCIAAIMKIVGVDPETEYINRQFTVFDSMFSDIYFGFMGESHKHPLGHFYDIPGNGYIIEAYGSVAMGHKHGGFKPDKNVTVRECLTFMLRCLKERSDVSWENVMVDSVEIGLLKESELEYFAADSPLLKKDFITLLNRMLNLPRYLYLPVMIPPRTRSFMRDQTGSMLYIEWYYQMKEQYKDYEFVTE